MHSFRLIWRMNDVSRLDLQFRTILYIDYVDGLFIAMVMNMHLASLRGQTLLYFLCAA